MNSILCQDREIYPSKVVCIGRNYVDHIKELNNEVPTEMVFFIKPNSAISNKLVLPRNAQECHYEAEISFLIEEGQISAVAFGLDLTLRSIQSRLKKSGLPWERAKAFDQSAVFSKFVPIIYKNQTISIELYINNKLCQKGDIDLMINKPLEIINEAKSFLTFEDGDILMTGTPSGVGKMHQGDIFLGKIFVDEKLIVQNEFHIY